MSPKRKTEGRKTQDARQDRWPLCRDHASSTRKKSCCSERASTIASISSPKVQELAEARRLRHIRSVLGDVLRLQEMPRSEGELWICLVRDVPFRRRRRHVCSWRGGIVREVQRWSSRRSESVPRRGRIIVFPVRRVCTWAW